MYAELTDHKFYGTIECTCYSCLPPSSVNNGERQVKNTAVLKVCTIVRMYVYSIKITSLLFNDSFCSGIKRNYHQLVIISILLMEQMMATMKK